MNHLTALTCYIPNESAMLDLGWQLAKIIDPTAVIYLVGDLGAGKTTLVRGFLHGLGYELTVKSPTYTLVESYEFPQRVVHHFDFYRIHHASELEFIGLQEYFDHAMTCFIEWPERALGFLPPADLTLHINHLNNNQREVIISAQHDRESKILEYLSHAWPAA